MEVTQEFEHNVLGKINREKMDTLMVHAILKHFCERGLQSYIKKQFKRIVKKVGKKLL